MKLKEIGETEAKAKWGNMNEFPLQARITGYNTAVNEMIAHKAKGKSKKNKTDIPLCLRVLEEMILELKNNCIQSGDYISLGSHTGKIFKKNG